GGFQHVVEEHEGSDAAALSRRQGAQNRLAFDVFRAGFDGQHSEALVGRGDRIQIINPIVWIVCAAVSNLSDIPRSGC
nr:hypothetical protein [Tanacetum cinerariifolium]